MAPSHRTSLPGNGPIPWRGKGSMVRAGILLAVFGAGVAVGATAGGALEPASPHRSSDAVTVRSPDEVPDPAAAIAAPGAHVAAVDTTTGAAFDGDPLTRTPAPAQETASRSDDAVPAPELETIDDRLLALAGEVRRLQQRVASLEQLRVTSGGPASPADGPGSDDEPPVLSVDTPEDRWVALVGAGVEEEQADAIIERQAQHALARLSLRDRAVREGWADSERFREESQRLRRGRVELRSEVGDDAFDQYLFSTGAPNRVQVESVIQGSAAERYGLMPGDLIEGYADSRVFTGRELREATSQGILGEMVPVQIRRDDEILEAWLPRGPIGIRLDSVRLAPAR